ADFTVFRGLVEVACQGGASGFLAGRAIWKDAFREKTLAAQMEYVRTQGVRNFQALADLAHRHARPWWAFYGGKEEWQAHFGGLGGEGGGEGGRPGALLRRPRSARRLVERAEQQHLRDDPRDLRSQGASGARSGPVRRGLPDLRPGHDVGVRHAERRARVRSG